ASSPMILKVTTSPNTNWASPSSGPTLMIRPSPLTARLLSASLGSAYLRSPRSDPCHHVVPMAPPGLHRVDLGAHVAELQEPCLQRFEVARVQPVAVFPLL